MAYILDTNVAIRLRDGDDDIVRRVGELDGAVMLSIITRVELEGGVHRTPAEAGVRRARLDALLAALPVLAFDDAAADAYAAIVAAAGYSRRKLLDRMIAAQALVHRASLVTMNPRDFADVPNLDVVAWDV
jgi:tRNA(fMet)-specific endonuclease VapC